jgi:mannose-6-phosphate isomerase
VLRGVPVDGWVRYETDAEEFLLRRWDGDDPTAAGCPVPDGGPRILLCTSGVARVRAPEEDRELRRGQAVWLGAKDTGVTVFAREPGTRLFLAADGLDT